MNKVQKTRGIPTDYKKNKNPKRLESEKKEKPIFGNHSTTLNSDMRRRGKKVENVYSNVDFQTFNPLYWHQLYFGHY